MGQKNYSRRLLLTDPKNFGLEFSGNSLENFLKSYEDRKILPRPITIGDRSLKRGTKRGYYFPVFIEMIKDLQYLRGTKKYRPLGIKEWLENKYARVYNLYDIAELFRLQFLPESVLVEYLNNSHLTNTQKDKVMAFYENHPSYQEVKKSILNMLSQINISSEADMR
ncbi:MAG: hypothetical protein ISS81_01375 [Candidatus Marinimicrobia bacterium]|nr:hypothetical protein [Candidatus Neomarinimicrobiota bacterium]